MSLLSSSLDLKGWWLDLQFLGNPWEPAWGPLSLEVGGIYKHISLWKSPNLGVGVERQTDVAKRTEIAQLQEVLTAM